MDVCFQKLVLEKVNKCAMASYEQFGVVEQRATPIPPPPSARANGRGGAPVVYRPIKPTRLILSLVILRVRV